MKNQQTEIAHAEVCRRCEEIIPLEESEKYIGFCEICYGLLKKKGKLDDYKL